MIKKSLVSVLLISILFIGCGGGISPSNNVNSNKSANSLGYYDDLTVFNTSVVTGFWIQRDVKYGFESLYYFANEDKLDMNDSQIDYFYDNNNYGVDVTGDKLYTYKFYKYQETVESNETNESNITTTYYDYNKSVVEYFDFNNVNNGNSCLEVSKYKIENGDTTYNRDYNLCVGNSGFTLHTFGTHLLLGQWVQYEYDDNDTAKTSNGLGIDFLYKFESNGRVSMNISLIDTWIPLGKYATNTQNDTLTYEMGSNKSLEQWRFIEHREPIAMPYQDENNVSQSRDIPCIKVQKYKINENNNSTTLDKNYQLCKQY